MVDLRTKIFHLSFAVKLRFFNKLKNINVEEKVQSQGNICSSCTDAADVFCGKGWEQHCLSWFLNNILFIRNIVDSEILRIIFTYLYFNQNDIIICGPRVLRSSKVYKRQINHRNHELHFCTCVICMESVGRILILISKLCSTNWKNAFGPIIVDSEET